MIEYFKRSVRDEKLKRIDKKEKGCLINVVAPTDDELKFLSDKFKLNIDLLKDGL